MTEASSTCRRLEQLKTAVNGQALATTVLAAAVMQACAPLFPSVLHSATSKWTSDSRLNLAVCTAPGNQVRPVMVADGSGGAIVAWMDKRGDDWDVYGQHLLATGAVDPAWPADGRAACAARKDQVGPQIDSDGAGGAIIVWLDHRGDDWDVYAQHLLVTGTLDPAWPADGRPICTAGGDQRHAALLADGIGGAVVVWVDPGHGLQAQRVLMNGTLDSAWPPAGRTLCESDSTNVTFGLVADADSGAIVVWSDGGDVRALHLMSSGAIDPRWPGDERLLSSGPGVRRSLAVVADGAGGALVAWNEEHSYREGDVFVQHVEANGIVDPAWPANGCKVAPTQVVSVAPGEGWGTLPRPPLVADGAGGALVICGDFSRSLHHVTSNGVLDPSWPEGGCRLSGYFGDHGFQLVADGAGGAMVTWSHELDGIHFSWKGRYLTHEGNVIGQHVLASGVFGSRWPKAGRDVSAARGRQFNPCIITDGTGGAIIVWQDWRADVLVGSDYMGDLYAQRVRPDGKLGGAVVARP